MAISGTKMGVGLGHGFVLILGQVGEEKPLKSTSSKNKYFVTLQRVPPLLIQPHVDPGVGQQKETT